MEFGYLYINVFGDYIFRFSFIEFLIGKSFVCYLEYLGLIDFILIYLGLIEFILLVNCK